jgi:hypothetical protein
LAIQLSAIIACHDEINFHDGQVKFDFARPIQDRKPIFPAIRMRNRAPPITVAKTIPKKCQSSREISATGKFFWLMGEFHA